MLMFRRPDFRFDARADMMLRRFRRAAKICYDLFSYAFRYATLFLRRR